MVDEEQLKRDFIDSRKKHNELLKLNQQGKDYNWCGELVECKPFRLDEQPLNENPNLMVVKYKDGKGCMVVDMDKLDKIPKAKQNKIFNLGKER